LDLNDRCSMHQFISKFNTKENEAVRDRLAVYAKASMYINVFNLI